MNDKSTITAIPIYPYLKMLRNVLSIHEESRATGSGIGVDCAVRCR
ncbi:MAG: hypothetical protein GPOALKHO_001162 [Sodalis sp.]|nr:MAG: hypothetical protein GPOALKHO_001162 [Sodalis sp.]